MGCARLVEPAFKRERTSLLSVSINLVFFLYPPYCMWAIVFPIFIKTRLEEVAKY